MEVNLHDMLTLWIASEAQTRGEPQHLELDPVVTSMEDIASTNMSVTDQRHKTRRMYLSEQALNPRSKRILQDLVGKPQHSRFFHGSETT